MKKIQKVFLEIVFLLLVFIQNVIASDYKYLNNIENNIDNINAEYILLYNMNDEKIIYEQNSNDKIAIASLTKIMTVLTTILNTKDLDKQVRVPNDSFLGLTGYAKAGFKPGDVVTIRDLLYGTLLPSGAEAAQSLAILVSGSIESFVNEMNKLKEEIGLNNTNFSNPVGMDDEKNYSTLNDLKKLLLYALKNEIFYEIYTTRFYKTTNNLELYSTLVPPANKYFLNIEFIKGAKSGFTNKAGLCLSSISEHNGINYLLIVANSLYADGFPNHIVDSLNIYNYFFENYDYENILPKNQEITSIKIKDSFDKNYIIKSNQDVSLFIKKEMLNNLKYEYEGITELNYKVKQNAKLGSVSVLYNDDVIYTFDVFLENKIKYKHTKLIIGILIFLILIFVIKIKHRKVKKNDSKKSKSK